MNSNSLDGIVALTYGYASNDLVWLCLLVLAHVLGDQIAAQTETNRDNSTLAVLLVQMLYHGREILRVAVGENACGGHLDTAQCANVI